MNRAETTQLRRWMAAGVLAFGLSIPGLSLANHPVFVEGNIDFDGDNRVGMAEDNDGPNGDRMGLTFGTLAGCVGMMNNGLNQNGTCLIVTSGNFVETVNITNQVTIEAASGVIANIEAFLVPNDRRLNDFPAAMMNPFALQSAPGIVVNSPNNRFVILRNLTVTNWTDGLRVMGDSHVLMENVNLDHNINNGVVVMDSAQIAIKNSSISSTGFRVNPMTGDFPTMMRPNPGIGINLLGTATAEVRDTTVAGSFGVAIQAPQGSQVEQVNNLLFDNNRSQELGAGGARPAAPAPAPAAPMAPTGPMAPGGAMSPSTTAP